MNYSTDHNVFTLPLQLIHYPYWFNKFHSPSIRPSR